MAENLMLFKGFKQVLSTQITGSMETGYVYFVRTKHEDGTYEGDIYFNGKHYGHFGDEAETLNAKLTEVIGDLAEAGFASGTTVAEALESVVQDIISVDARVDEVQSKVEEADAKAEEAQTKAEEAMSGVTALDGKVDEIASKVGEVPEGATASTVVGYVNEMATAVAKAAQDDIEALDARVESVESASTLNAESIEAINRRLDNFVDLVVESGRVVENASGETTIILTLNNGSEISFSANGLIDTYQGSEFISVENYIVSLKKEELIAALNLDQYALVADVEDLANQVEDAVSGIESAMTKTEEAVEALEGRVAVAETAITKAETEIEAVKGDVAEAVSAITEAKESIDAVDARVDGVEADIDGINEDIAGIESAMTEASEAIASLEEKIEEVEAGSQTLVAGEGVTISGDVIAANTEAVTTEDIQVTVDLGAGFAKNTTIPAGTSVQDLLVKLLSKELWDTTKPTVTTAFTVSLASGFAVTLSKTGNVEVGDAITVSALNAKSTSTHTQSYTVSKFDYGFKIGADGEYQNKTGNTVTLTPTKTADGNVLSEIFSKFKDENGDYIEDIENVTANSLDALTVYASEGVNKVTAYQTGDTYASATAESQTYYTATNLKNYTKSATDDSDNTYVASPSFAASKTATGSSVASVTGCYKYFYGFTEASLDYTSLIGAKADIPASFTGAFMTGNSAEIAIMESNDSKSSLVLVLPASYTITGTKNKLGSDVKVDSTWIEQNTFNYVNGNTTTSYKVYVKHSAEATKYLNITFTK